MGFDMPVLEMRIPLKNLCERAELLFCKSGEIFENKAGWNNMKDSQTATTPERQFCWNLWNGMKWKTVSGSLSKWDHTLSYNIIGQKAVNYKTNFQIWVIGPKLFVRNFLLINQIMLIFQRKLCWRVENILSYLFRGWRLPGRRCRATCAGRWRAGRSLGGRRGACGGCPRWRSACRTPDTGGSPSASWLSTCPQQERMEQGEQKQKDKVGQCLLPAPSTESNI